MHSLVTQAGASPTGRERTRMDVGFPMAPHRRRVFHAAVFPPDVGREGALHKVAAFTQIDE